MLDKTKNYKKAISFDNRNVYSLSKPYFEKILRESISPSVLSEENSVFFLKLTESRYTYRKL